MSVHQVPQRASESLARVSTATQRPRHDVDPSGTGVRTEKHQLGGLFVCKYRWGLSLWGKLLLGLLMVGVATCIGLSIYSFLAVTERVDARVLVVEGWMRSYGIKAAAEEFRNGKYKVIYTTGGPVVGKGGYINDWNTSASVGAEQLKKTGLPADKIQMVPCRVIDRDRTYSSAVALQDWFSEHHLHVKAINIVTEAPHARRTRLLFQQALGPNVEVGVIAISSPDFDQQHWWRYSEGVEDAINEGVGYLYAKFLFRPSEAEKRASTP